MPCYSPVKAIRVDGVVKLLSSVHDPSPALHSFKIQCGRCIGCRLRYSQMWAIRCVHEASLYDSNCVITVTYRDRDMPKNGSLFYRDFQLFMKRLRQFRRRFLLREVFHAKRVSMLTPVQRRQLVRLSAVRFFVGAEYGERTLRPHYHACLFNFDFPDKRVITSRDGQPSQWFSQILVDLWQKGDLCSVGRLDFDSAAYVARYVVKKVYGDLADDHYRVGEDEELTPEFACMSRRPGIGMPWIHKFYKETVRDLSVTSKGKRVHMPRVYQKYVEQIADCSNARLELEKRLSELDLRPARLLAASRIASARLGLSRRKL